MSTWIVLRGTGHKIVRYLLVRYPYLDRVFGYQIHGHRRTGVQVAERNKLLHGHFSVRLARGYCLPFITTI